MLPGDFLLTDHVNLMNFTPIELFCSHVWLTKDLIRWRDLQLKGDIFHVNCGARMGLGQSNLSLFTRNPDNKGHMENWIENKKKHIKKEH